MRLFHIGEHRILSHAGEHCFLCLLAMLLVRMLESTFSLLLESLMSAAGKINRAVIVPMMDWKNDQ